MEIAKLKNILEAVLLGADRTLTVVHMEGLFELDEERPTRDEIRKALHEMADDYETRGYELKQVASGFRLQVRQEYATWVGRLWEEKPARYTRALLETMSLIAYRQPITRGEIEEVRGVSVSSNIIKTLMERDWIKVLGHKDVPGKPTLYGTTKEFLDYFNLKTLDQLPTLAEIKDLESIHPELELDDDANTDANTSNDLEKPDENLKDDDIDNASDASTDDTSMEANSIDESVNEVDAAESELDDEIASSEITSGETMSEDEHVVEEAAEDVSTFDDEIEAQEETEKQVSNV
ncbi:Segregation and condensation protein B [hydrothermal vent metagenome]|uniref:Segregation and condensation protein B n=1 Tax=hydrothermal vent metagenome TaxID=652676 RepID=A0A3B0WRB9_9ZZZZ